MILNHKEAIRYLVDQAPNLQISPDTICTMHFLLADSLVEPHLAGRIRDHGVRVGGSVYPPYENTTKIRELLHEITEKASQIQDPFEQSLFLLAHISYLQAFSDVNNRTARLCANIPLVIHNLVPISFIDIERSDYLSAILAIYELQEIRPLADLYIQSYFRTCALYDAHTASMGFDEVRVRYRAHRRACLREIILACMDPKMVHLFAKQHALTLPVEVQTAFIQDVLEDLDLMDNVRMVGLGISLQDLQKWQLAYSQPPR